MVCPVSLSVVREGMELPVLSLKTPPIEQEHRVLPNAQLRSQRSIIQDTKPDVDPSTPLSSKNAT